ncbi:RHS repeat-associated core domain-containing protein [Pseudomonas putida]|nr:RHS repeat-associated core domain-containing protein [Pseudomonas putida]
MHNDVIKSTYTSYGYSPAVGTLHIVGFMGAPWDKWSKCYPLGAGKRCYNPALMRFLSPDSLSPFSAGGLNAYVYCSADPINRLDPSGESWIKRLFSRPEPSYKMTEIIAAHDHPKMQMYYGWRFSSKTTGWDVKMAMKLPKRLEMKAQLERDVLLSRTLQEHVVSQTLEKRLRYVESKIQATDQRLRDLISGLSPAELAITLSQIPGAPPPPYAETGDRHLPPYPFSAPGEIGALIRNRD